MGKLSIAMVLVTVFVSGAAMMSLEILGARVLQVYFGSSILVWASVISVVLAAIGVGYYVGGTLADRMPTIKLYAALFLLAGFFFLVIQEIANPVSSAIVTRRFGQNIDPILASMVFFPACFVMGAVPAFASRVLMRTLKTAGKTVGSVYAISTAGSILGTLATAFYLIPLYGVREVIVRWGVALFLTGILILLVVRKRAAVAVVAASLLLLPSAMAATSVAPRKVLFRRDSLYHNILVEDIGRQRVLRFDDAWQSKMSLGDLYSGAFEYCDYFNAGFVFNPEIRDVLFLGLGGGSGPKQFLKDYPEAQIDVAEIDPVVLKVAKKYFYLPNSPRLNVTIEDGRVFLRRSKKRYDLIVVDAYSSSPYGAHIPFHMATVEFFSEVDRHLAPNGVLIYNVIGNVVGWGDKIVRSLFATMQETFPNVYAFPVRTSENVVLCATKLETRFSVSEIAARGQELLNERKLRLPATFVEQLSLCEPEPMNVRNLPVLTDNYAPVDNLLR